MRLKIGAVVLAALMLVGAAVAFAQAGDGAADAPADRQVVAGDILGDTLKVTPRWITQPAPQAAVRGYDISSPAAEGVRDEIHRVFRCVRVEAVESGGAWDDARRATGLSAGEYDVRVWLNIDFSPSTGSANCASGTKRAVVGTYRVTLGS